MRVVKSNSTFGRCAGDRACGVAKFIRDVRASKVFAALVLKCNASELTLRFCCQNADAEKEGLKKGEALGNGHGKLSLSRE